MDNAIRTKLRDKPTGPIETALAGFCKALEGLVGSNTVVYVDRIDEVKLDEEDASKETSLGFLWKVILVNDDARYQRVLVGVKSDTMDKFPAGFIKFYIDETWSMLANQEDLAAELGKIEAGNYVKYMKEFIFTRLPLGGNGQSSK